MTSHSSTYRIQFNKDFNFKDLDRIIPYLKDLGIGMIYASPIFEAFKGSTHGYDVVNPLAINPEIGTEEELVAISEKLKNIGIGWLQDIVPNHMSFTSGNLWLMDVLENWDKSFYFKFFDINFTNVLEDKRLMVPFLGETLNEAIEQQKLTLVLEESKLYLKYSEDNWPVNSTTYNLVADDFKGFVGSKSGINKIRLILQKINENVGLLRQVVDNQFYRLCHWQETEKQINYRRFFTVNSLICLNIQDEDVFNYYHQYIYELVKRGVFQGLRIDHIDGLYDPTAYLKRLRNAVGDETYIVAEKILAKDEEMPKNWQIEGSTGYDFLAIVNNFFTNKAAKRPFSKLYHEVIQKPVEVAEQILLKKSAILYGAMKGELDNLHELFVTLNLATKKDLNSIKEGSLKEAIANFLIHFTVYRCYANSFPLPDQEVDFLKDIFSKIPKTEESLPAINLLTTTLFDSNRKNKDYQQRALYFYQRCMQFSGPLMAKGVEDTLMYTYNRFIGHTEVGDTPNSFGLSVASFHKKMINRQLNFPLSINATSTHDTKRGEDVRTRLNVITDIPAKWKTLVLDLKANNCEDGKLVLNLHQNDAYLIYQTVMGALPYEAKYEKDLQQRLESYIEKALREAKKRSEWATPNENYELDAKNFAISLLDKTQHNYKSLQKFLAQIEDYSILNSLAQLMLKCTCPGVPDIYQGTELWDLSLVDPDNRRPVDYNIRISYLKEVHKANLRHLWDERKSGKVKLWLTQILLKFRKNNQTLFDKGTYIPLTIKGKYKKHIIAYLRRYNKETLMVVVPVGLAKLDLENNQSLKDFDWENTRIKCPIGLPSQWLNVLTDCNGHTDILNNDLSINDIFSDIPLALLSFKATNSDRGSGILLHVSSLPSKFGIGDLGPSAFEFVDFLSETKQKYWQMLPLNPTMHQTLHSPYAASSAMAGNILFISLEFLAKYNLLTQRDLKKAYLPNTANVDFDAVEVTKCNLINLSYKNYLNLADQQFKDSYTDFCKKESYWLNDYALFICIRKHHDSLPWNQWPDKYKLCDQKALNKFENEFVREIDELKWQQFIFHLQWHNLRDYANNSGISLIGDLPYYVGYDSADVWADHKYFKLNANLEMDGVAGVPPDVFNDNGQLWGMPIFRWDVLKKDNYLWWMNRIKKNIELFDYIRLDHFRAFDTYWEVPSNEENATNGKWKKGPGKAFFDAVFKELGKLPFIVEDLGSDLMGTDDLRMAFDFPGMKVLEFGFGSDIVSSTHIPHNYNSANTVVYVGTHDNNTSLGWFRQELTMADKSRLTLYAGQELNEKNITFIMIRIALASSAKIAILQMQDLLGLNEFSRMNTPATTSNNWVWRMKNLKVKNAHKKWLKQQTRLFARA